MHQLLFQFTPLHERQHATFLLALVFLLFQFTPLHERQHLLLSYSKLLKYFNSRLYMRGSLNFSSMYSPQCDFNSRLYMRGSLKKKVSHICSLFQFTPLHERQLQKYTIFSIKSTQFSTKPCFFIVTSRKVVFFSIPVQYFL